MHRAFLVALSAGVLASALSSSAWLAAQSPLPIDAIRVRDLLVLVAAPDRQGALDAANELQRMGPAVAPTLIEALKKNPACQVQWVASGVLRQLQLAPALVETTLVEMARGTCRASSVADLNLQQDAAFAIIDRPRGIALMTELLRGKDDLARRRAAFAFDALTERLRPEHPRTIAATPEILAATAAALQPLRDTAVSKAPLAIRCLAFAAIEQARSLPHAALAARATSLLHDVRVDCGPPPAKSDGRSAPTRMRPEGLEERIARLDRQPPSLAAQTSSALVAAPDDVVPLLQAQLRRTNSCQGLALVAGVLAARNVAEADVEAALGRVVAGKCDGREPFAMSLGQSAANASIGRPGGIARLAGHLTDRDADVRHRAATALAGLFASLGMGEAARPTSDPAILGAAQAALPALLTVAQTERDMPTRCAAVLAIQRAQEARDERLRGEAVAQSQGRTLRCQAPPTR